MNRSQLVPLVIAHLREQGVDVSALVARFGLLQAEVATEIEVPIERMHEFLEAAERAANDPLLGVHIAERRRIGAHGLLEYCWRNAANVGAAMTYAAAQFTLYGHRAKMIFERKGPTATFARQVPSSPLGAGKLGNEFFVATTLIQMRELTEHPFLPSRVLLAHPSHENIELLEKAFGTRNITFGAPLTGFEFDATLADLPLQKADPNLYAVLTGYVAHLTKPMTSAPEVEPAAADLTTLLRETIRKRLAHGEPQLAELAAACKTSPRTLQRRLGESGETLQHLIDSVREEQARRTLLSEDLPLTELAARLGYRDTKSLLRAFKRWTGMTPGRFRQQRS